MGVRGFLAMLLTVFLAACGGSSGPPAVDPPPPPPPPPDPDYVTVPAMNFDGPSASAISYNAANDTTSFGDRTFTYSGVTGLAPGIRTYRDLTFTWANAAEYMIRGVSPSGEGTVLLWGNDGARYRFARIEEGLLPTNGTLVYSNGGDSGSLIPNYSAAYERSFATGDSWGHLTGSASVRLELDNGMMRATISNRQNTAGTTLEPVAFPLQSARFDTFSSDGTLFELLYYSGGQFSTDRNPGDGIASFGGIILDDGNEALFSVRFSFETVDQAGRTVRQTEIGVFSAERFTLCDGCADGS